MSDYAWINNQISDKAFDLAELAVDNDIPVKQVLIDLEAGFLEAIDQWHEHRRDEVKREFKR